MISHFPTYFQFILSGTRKPIFASCIKFMIVQIKMTIQILKMSKNVDTIIFFVGGTSLILPLFISFILNKNIISIITASDATKINHSNELFGLSRKIMSYLTNIFEHINYIFSTQLVVYSKNVVDQLNINKYSYKISTEGSRYIDNRHFNLQINYTEREMIIGYIGRLSEEKGILNLVKAIAIISKKCPDLKFLIIGDGILMHKVLSEIEHLAISDRINLLGSISHDEIGFYLNKIKLLVIPSYTETGPQIALESMACGTPILATKVGLIPDIIKDFQNGYILDNNDPQTIADGIIKGIFDPCLPKVSKKSIDTIIKNYSYNSAVKRYSKILEVKNA